MKPTHLKWLMAAGFACTVITLLSWKRTDSTMPVKPYSIHAQDDTTVPHKRSLEKKEYKIGDLDEAMKELDRAMLSMDNNVKIDMSKMDKEIKAALEEVKKIDFEKIGREVEASMKKIDWEKTRVEVDKAMREAEVKMKDIDMKKIEKEIEKAKEDISAAKIESHIDMEKIKRSVDEGLAGARVGLEKAKKELSLMKEFTEALEKDGLINRKKGYKIEIKDGQLFINGTKQTKEVNDKYRKYFKDEDYTIKNDGDSISNL